MTTALFAVALFFIFSINAVKNLKFQKSEEKRKRLALQHTYENTQRGIKALQDDPFESTQCTPYIRKHIPEIREIASKIEQTTLSSDVLVFIGNSGAYIEPFLRCSRKTRLFAASGTSYLATDGNFEYFKGNYQFFKEYFWDIVGTENEKNLVFIDHSTSGNSIRGLEKVLGINIMNRFINLIAFDFHGLSGVRKNIFSPELSEIIRQLYDPDNKGDIPRVMPHYPPCRWNQPPENKLSPNPEEASSATQAGFNCVENIAKIYCAKDQKVLKRFF